jgi:hypothetical protein
MDIGVETGQTNHHLVMHREDFLGVRRQSLRLNSEPSVRSDSNAILASHSHKGGAVVGHDGHDCGTKMASALKQRNLVSTMQA